MFNQKVVSMGGGAESNSRLTSRANVTTKRAKSLSTFSNKEAE